MKMITKYYKTDFQVKLGKGSFGEVFLGFNKETCEEVAVKRIENDGEGEFFNCTVDKELENMKIVNAKCKHENIVQFLDFYKDDFYLYFIMEYCNGLDLGHYLTVNTLDDRTQLKILYECASAIEFLHSQRIVHRDIKMSNVLLKESSENKHEITVKISDFGFAKVFHPNEDSEFMNSDMGLGSMGFRAPELFYRGQIQYTPAIDVFSLGLVYLHVIGYSEKLQTVCAGFIGYGMALALCKEIPGYEMPQLFEKCDQNEEEDNSDDWPDSKLKSLLSRMIQQNYEDRPNMEEIKKELSQIKQEFEEKYPEVELHPDSGEKCLVKQKSQVDWILLDIPDESPRDQQCTQWKQMDITNVFPGDHICWWCDKDDHTTIPYWRHAVVTATINSKLTLIGWKFYSENKTYQPEIVTEDIDFAKQQIQVACYQDCYYSPDETIDRARSLLGDRDYNSISNYARAFPRWCKTGYGGITFTTPERRMPIWETVNIKEVQVGDHICWWTWPKGVYWRHAVVSKQWEDGHITVIGWRFKPKCEIVETDVSFKETKHVYRAKHHKVACFGVKEIIKRARSRIGNTDYNIITNYARAFPRWCVTGYGGVFT